MPKVTLLQTRHHEYHDEGDLEKLIKKHQGQLGTLANNLNKPGADAAINAIAYNLVLLMRERNRLNRHRASLHVLDGGKKD